MIYTWFFMQTNMPVEETRKKVWLVDSKVVVQTSFRFLLFYFISIC